MGDFFFEGGGGVQELELDPVWGVKYVVLCWGKGVTKSNVRFFLGIAWSSISRLSFL